MKRVINSKRGTDKEIVEPVKKTSKKKEESVSTRKIDPNKDEVPDEKG